MEIVLGSIALMQLPVLLRSYEDRTRKLSPAWQAAGCIASCLKQAVSPVGQRQTLSASAAGYGRGVLLLQNMLIVVYASSQALSPVGRCQTFSASADGYGRGEGFAVIALRAGSSDMGGAAVAVIRVRLVIL